MRKSLKYLVAAAVAGSACMKKNIKNLTKYMHRSLLAASLFFGVCPLSNCQRAFCDSVKLSGNELINSGGVIEALGKTHLFVLISSYEKRNYVPYVVECMEANVKRLEQFGVAVKILVHCDACEGKNGTLRHDLDTYVSCLDSKKIAFKVRKNACVKPSVLKVAVTKETGVHWELVANEKNLGCSGTRHAGIDAIEEEVKELKKQGKRVYIGIFDGDDFIHPDFYLLLTANAFATNDGATVSSYNGDIGAHGLNVPFKFRPFNKPFFGSSGEESMLISYWDEHVPSGKKYEWVKCSRETAIGSAKDKNERYTGSCCTTRIFEGGYLYEQLERVAGEELIKQPLGKSRTLFRMKYVKKPRSTVCLKELSVLDPFNSDAVTCTTEQSLFFYNNRDNTEGLRYNESVLRQLRWGESDKETEDEVPNYRAYFKAGDAE